MAGSFAVTSCTVSKSIIAPTDTVDITLTIKNVTGSKVVTFGASFYFNSEDLGISSGGWAPTFSAQASVSWANNTSKTFSYSICPDSIMSQPLYSNYYNTRVKPRLAALKTLPFRISMTGVCSDGSGVGEDYTFSNLRYIDQWYRPVITLDAWRYPDDEGVNLAATMKVELADGSNADRFTATMHYAQDGKATTSSPVFNMNVDRDVLFGVGYSSNTAILPGTFNNGSVFSFLLVVSDGYETVTAQITVDRAFANLHLSGKTTGGVAFGRFSTAQQGVPKFECDYPAYFYGGIEGVTNYRQGEVATGGTWIDGRPIYRQVLAFTVTQTGAFVEAARLVQGFAGIGVIINVHGCVVRKTGGKIMPYMFWQASSNLNSVHFNEDGAVLVYTTTAADFYLVVEYTRGSDNG